MVEEGPATVVVSDWMIRMDVINRRRTCEKPSSTWCGFLCSCGRERRKVRSINSRTLDSFTTITTATGSATHVPIIISHDKTYSSSTAWLRTEEWGVDGVANTQLRARDSHKMNRWREQQVVVLNPLWSSSSSRERYLTSWIHPHTALVLSCLVFFKTTL